MKFPPEINAMTDESETQGARIKLKTIQNAIKVQTDPANKLTLKEIKVLPKNKILGENYFYYIQSIILQYQLPETMPTSEKLKAVIRWENTTTPTINYQPTCEKKRWI